MSREKVTHDRTCGKAEGPCQNVLLLGGWGEGGRKKKWRKDLFLSTDAVKASHVAQGICVTLCPAGTSVRSSNIKGPRRVEELTVFLVLFLFLFFFLDAVSAWKNNSCDSQPFVMSQWALPPPSCGALSKLYSCQVSGNTFSQVLTGLSQLGSDPFQTFERAIIKKRRKKSIFSNRRQNWFICQ